MGVDNPSDQVPDAFRAGLCSPDAGERDFGLRIAGDGTWYHQGAPIRRPALVRLFASVLRREPDGSYWLVTPVERGRIEVEDVPFVAVELERKGTGRGQELRIRTNLDEWVTIGPAHPIRLRHPTGQAAGGGRAPYVEVRPGLEARLARPVYYELVELGCEEQIDGRRRFGVWSEGRFFPLDNES